MKRFQTLFIAGLIIMNAATASAQTTTAPAPVTKRNVTILKSHEFTLSNVSSIRVVNQRLNGAALPAPRYHIKALYTPAPGPCPVGMACVLAMPVTERASIILREWEYAADGIQDRILNICRRTIENARPNALVRVKGKVTIDQSGSEPLVYLQSITSCVLQYPQT